MVFILMSINSLVRHAFCYSMASPFYSFMLCAQASNEINGAKVLQGVAIEGGLIIALTKPGNKVIMMGMLYQLSRTDFLFWDSTGIRIHLSRLEFFSQRMKIL